MSLRHRLKSMVEEIPPPVGRVVASIPFSLRFGTAYTSMAREVRTLEGAPTARVRDWAYPRLQKIVDHAFHHNVAYRTICQRHRFHPSHLATFAHWQDVPIIDKTILREFELEERSTPARGRLPINTGGTSGSPLAFYVDGQAFAREWAHMHHIWGRAGYHYRDLKLTMRARNIGERLLKYNAVHNEWIVNTYADREAVLGALARLVQRVDIGWIHGYPSIVAEIVTNLAAAEPATTARLRERIKGVLLGSEFTALHYVEPIRRVLGVDTTAWYGHSEMCVLAYEAGENRYVPMHTYGFVEALADGAGAQRLLSTSYWNTAAPFIRYDTGDRITADVENGVVPAFSVTSGRDGDFVLDRKGAPIALTALIFGRHHAAFGKIQHLQVRQSVPGAIELLIVPRDHGRSLDALMQWFDFSNVDIDVKPVLIDAPIRTAGGKIRLLVQ